MISLLLSLSLFVTSSLALCQDYKDCAWDEYCDGNGVCRDPFAMRSMRASDCDCAWYEYCDQDGVCRDPHGRRNMGAWRHVEHEAPMRHVELEAPMRQFEHEASRATMGQMLGEHKFYSCEAKTGKGPIENKFETTCDANIDWAVWDCMCWRAYRTGRGAEEPGCSGDNKAPCYTSMEGERLVFKAVKDYQVQTAPICMFRCTKMNSYESVTGQLTGK